MRALRLRSALVLALFLPLSLAVARDLPGRPSVAEAAREAAAEASDDEAAWRATGAPMSIRPTAESFAKAPALVSAPLPPRPSLGGRVPGIAALSTPAPETPAEPAPTEAAPDTAPPAEAPAPSAPDNPSAFVAAPPLPEGPPGRVLLATLVPSAVPQISTPQEIEAEEEAAPEPQLVEKQTDAVNIACLKPELMAIVHKAARHFNGTPIVTSGQRDRGRRGSYHRKCMAADFFIEGVDRARLAKYLRGLPEAGGVGTYCHTRAVHIDIGDPRNWYQCGRRFRFAQR